MLLCQRISSILDPVVVKVSTIPVPGSCCVRGSAVPGSYCFERITCTWILLLWKDQLYLDPVVWKDHLYLNPAVVKGTAVPGSCCVKGSAVPGSCCVRGSNIPGSCCVKGPVSWDDAVTGRPQVQCALSCCWRGQSPPAGWGRPASSRPGSAADSGSGQGTCQPTGGHELYNCDVKDTDESRKIRLIESNAKYRYLKKFTCKGTLRQVFYLSEAPSPPMTPYFPPPYTQYKCMQNTYAHREGGRGTVELTREKVRWAIVHKSGGKYQHDWLYL